MMYRIAGFIDTAENQPGMMIPVFAREATNMLYVQVMDEHYYVIRFAPFVEVENYTIIYPTTFDQLGSSAPVSEGELGIIAFRDATGERRFGKLTAVMNFVEQNEKLLNDYPVLGLQLRRLNPTGHLDVLSLWEAASAQAFNDLYQQQLWVSQESYAFSKQREIWDRVNLEQTFREGAIEESELKAQGSEYLFEWLRSRKNFDSPIWPRIWHYVASLSPFDRRLFYTCEPWLFSRGDIAGVTRDYASILFLCLEHMRGERLPGSPMAEFLAEWLSTAPDTRIFVLQWRSLVDHIAWVLCRFGDADESANALLCLGERALDRPDTLKLLRAAIQQVLDDRSTEIEHDTADRATQFLARSIR
jgi:hypothetical protein